MIQINDDVKIDSDKEHNIVIKVRNTFMSKGIEKTSWVIKGYYPSLKSALLGVLNRDLFNSVSEETQLKDILTRIEKAEKEIITAIKKNNI